MEQHIALGITLQGGGYEGSGSASVNLFPYLLVELKTRM